MANHRIHFPKFEAPRFRRPRCVWFPSFAVESDRQEHEPLSMIHQGGNRTICFLKAVKDWGYRQHPWRFPPGFGTVVAEMLNSKLRGGPVLRFRKQSRSRAAVTHPTPTTQLSGLTEYHQENLGSDFMQLYDRYASVNYNPLASKGFEAIPLGHFFTQSTEVHRCAFLKCCVVHR
jgi:hypothetical protein